MAAPKQDRDQTIAELRVELWDIVFEAATPRSPEVVERDREPPNVIRDALAALGSDEGPRPGDLATRVE